MSFGVVNTDLLAGFLENIKLFGVTLLFAIPLGLVIAFGSMTKFTPVRVLTRAFVWIIRGTPLMLQLFVVFYAPGLLFDLRFPGSNPRMTAAAIAFVINYACYFSEIYRGGIESIPRGQYEAGHVLGMTKSQVFFKIVLMQVVKRIIPPMGNEIITLVKDTSLVRIVGALMFMGAQHKEILGKSFEYVSVNALIWPLFYTGAFYLLFCGGLTLLFGYLEKKLDYYKI